MQETLDHGLVQKDNTSINYGGFWQRLGAMVIDVLILLPFTFGLSYFNITSWKSSVLMVIVTTISIAYKPYMEFAYSATLGKKALKLKVTNLNFEKADLGTILFRNVFHIVPSLIGLLFSIAIYNDPGFESITNYQEYVSFSRQFSASQYVSYFFGVIAIVEAIMLISDQQNRSLHDRMAGTFVIETT